MASFEEKYRKLRKKREPEKKVGTRESRAEQTSGGGFAQQYQALKKKREDSPAGLPSSVMPEPSVNRPQTLSEAIAEQWKAQAAEKRAETAAEPTAPAQTEQAAEPYRGPAWAQEMAGRYKPAAADLEKRDARTAEYSPDKKPEATVKDWAGLVGNTLMAGVGQIDKAATATLSAAEQLIARPLGALLGNPELYKNGLFYVSDQEVGKAANQVQEDLAGSAEKTGKAGELIAKFGPATVAALPQAALAYLTAGQSVAAQASTAGLQAASAAALQPGIANTVLQAVQGMAKNPSFQYSFLNTVGGEYQQALEDGADSTTAYAYAALSSLANSLVEVGGGIDTLPEAVRGKSKGQLLEWVKSMFGEGKEEVVQGVISQLMQNGVYQKGNPIFSMTDENAVVNPGRMAEEFAGGAVVGGVLGGGQMAVNAAIDSAARRAAQNALQAQASPGDNQIPAEVQKNTARGAEEQPVKVGRATEIKNPYKGNTPAYRKPENSVRPQIKTQAVTEAQKQIIKAQQMGQRSGKSFKNFLEDFYEKAFQKDGGARGIAVTGAEMDGRPYIVTLNKSAVGKVISDKNVSAEKLAVFSALDDVIENGEYVGSSTYVQKGKKQKDTIRFDLFETPVIIEGKEYIVTFDVEVFPSSNNYRTHKVVNEMDLVPVNTTDTGTGQPQIQPGQGPTGGDTEPPTRTTSGLENQTVQPENTGGSIDSIQQTPGDVNGKKASPAAADETKLSSSQTSETGSGQTLSGDTIQQTAPAVNSQSAELMTGRLVRMGEPDETAARLGELLGRVKDGQTLTDAEMSEVQNNPNSAKLIDAVQELAARRAAEDMTGGQQDAGEQEAGKTDFTTDLSRYREKSDAARAAEQLGEVSVPDRQRERGIGTDSSEQAGAVPEGAEGWAAEDRRSGAAADDGKIPVSVREETIPDRASGTQSLRAIARQNAVTESGAEMVSTRQYMGLDIGSDRPSLFDAPEEVIRSDKVLSEVYDTIWEEGYRPHMFTGSPELADANLVFDGAVNGEDVYIRIDQGRYDADAIWEHERFHILSAEDPGLRSSVRDALLQQYDQAELMKIMETYLEKYRGAYGMETVQGLWDLSEADMDLILEELLADAYAGKDTFRAGTGKYRDTVREIASWREEQGYRTEGTPEAARFDVGYSQGGKKGSVTEETTGLSLPTLEDRGKNTKLQADEDTSQRTAPAERRKAASRKLADDLSEIFPETSRKYLRGLADEVRSGAVQEQLDALFNEAYDSARVYDESPEAAELREIAKELRGRRVYVDESVREAFEDDWKSMRNFFMGNGLYFTGDRNDMGLDVLNGELASRFGGRFNENETDLENVISRLEYVLRAGAAKQITLDEQARQYGGEEAVQKFREAYRQKFMDAAEGYRDTMSGIAEDQRKAREEARRRQRQELEDYLEEARRTLRDRAAQGKDTGRTDPRTHVPEGMTIDEYVQSLEQRAAQAREERLRDLQREDFRGSEAMEKLGVKISGAVTEDYQNAPELRRRQEAAEKARRAVRRAEKRMNATEAEKEFAAGITSGIYTESDIPRTMNADRVMELADYYMGERAFGFDMLRQRKADISRAQQEKAKEIFGPALEASEGKQKLAGGVMGALGDAFALNNRTAERNMRAIFGDEAGDRINRWLFAPVAENEGERYRFVNRMLD